MGSPPSWLQQPRTQFPGAEYFALVPGRSIALGPRLSLFKSGTATAVPASGLVGIQVSLPLLPVWNSSDAIYIVRAWVLYIPSDATGQLQIVNTRMSIGSLTAGGLIDIGFAALILTTAAAPQTAIADRDVLLTFHDMLNLFPPGDQLILQAQVTAKNLDAANPHSFNIQPQCIFHSLTGFVT